MGLKMRPLPQHSPDDVGLEKLREIAQEMLMDWSFHETAISDPFKAECELHDYGRRIQEIVGWPEGWEIWEPEE